MTHSVLAWEDLRWGSRPTGEVIIVDQCPADFQGGQLLFYKAREPKQPFDEFCSSLAPSVRSNENGSTLTAWCKVGDNASGNEWWSIFLDMRELGFLLP